MNDNKVRIINLNVNRNLIKNIYKLKQFINIIDPDIVILTETGLKNDDEQIQTQNTIQTYKWNFNNETYDITNERRKGTAIAVKKNIAFMPDEQIITKINDTRGRIQYVTVLINKAIINVIAVYQTSGEINLDSYIETNNELNQIIKLINTDENLIIAGDFNASLQRKPTKIDKEFKNLLTQTQTYSINHKLIPNNKTWYQRGVDSSAQTIDHIITRYTDKITITKIKTKTPNFYTDHEAIIMEAKIFKANKPLFQRHNIKLPNKEEKSKLNKIEIQASTIDELQKAIQDKCNEICKTTSRNKFNTTENDKIKRRKKLTKIARKTIKIINQDNWRINKNRVVNRLKRLNITIEHNTPDKQIIASIRNKIMHIENELNSMIKEIITQNIIHNREKAINNKNTKKIFHALAPKQRNTQHMIALRNEQQIIKSNKNDVNKICVNEIKRNFTARTNPPNEIIQTIIENTWEPTQQTIPFQIDTNAIRKTLNKHNKTPGNDNVRKEHLIEILFNQKKPSTNLNKLTQIIQNDDGWENTTRAIICPIHKKGDQTVIANWRKITLLNEINKVIQTIINTNVIKHAQQNKTISNLEFGFYPGRNAHQATQLLTNVIENARYYREEIAIATLDMTDAYGSAEHKILNNILERININKNTTKINNNIRKHTTFSMMTIHGTTPPQNADRNLSQGAVDSPILFSLYTEPITRTAIKSNKGYQINKKIGEKAYDLNIPLTKYADDITTIANNSKKINELHNEITKVTDALGLNFSTPEKNNSIHINYKTGTAKTINTNIKIKQLTTTQIKDGFIKYLGLYIEIKPSKQKIDKITLERVKTAINRIKYSPSIKTITNIANTIPLAITKYQWKTTLTPDTFTKKIDKLILTTIKRKSGTPLTTRTAIIRAPYEYGGMNVRTNIHIKNGSIITHILDCLNSANYELAETTELRIKQELTLPIKRNKKNTAENTTHRFLMILEKYQLKINKNDDSLDKFVNETINRHAPQNKDTIKIIKALNAKNIHLIQDVTENGEIMSRRTLQRIYETSINRTQHEFLKSIDISKYTGTNNTTNKYKDGRYGKIRKINNDNVIIATDGSNNKIAAGYGIAIYDEHRIEIKSIAHKIEPTDSAQKAELLAVALALKITKKQTQITIITDSKYVVNVLNKEQSTDKIKDHQDIVNAIQHLKKHRNITTIKVESHTNNEDFNSKANKKADELANKGRNAEKNKTIIKYIKKHRPKYYLTQHGTPIWNIDKMMKQIEREERITNLEQINDPRIQIINDKEYDRKLSNAYMNNKNITEITRNKMWRYRIRTNKCNAYLYDIGASKSPYCTTCSVVDHHGHKLTECRDNEINRNETIRQINQTLREAQIRQNVHLFTFKEDTKEGACNIEATGAILKETKEIIKQQIGREATKMIVDKIQEIISKYL
jgi:ribonuclease HI/endonuclease/exonuclease/phosphatase family metal-dependent hydrolase